MVTTNWTFVRPSWGFVQIRPGAAIVVLSGPGVGQHRTVTGFDNHTGLALVTVDSPFDNFLNTSSVLAVVPRIGATRGHKHTFGMVL